MRSSTFLWHVTSLQFQFVTRNNRLYFYQSFFVFPMHNLHIMHQNHDFYACLSSDADLFCVNSSVTNTLRLPRCEVVHLRLQEPSERLTHKVIVSIKHSPAFLIIFRNKHSFVHLPKSAERIISSLMWKTAATVISFIYVQSLLLYRQIHCADTDFLSTISANTHFAAYFPVSWELLFHHVHRPRKWFQHNFWSQMNCSDLYNKFS
jgi:hypothetical protein